MGRPALANSLLSVADLMDDMVDEIATDERGPYVLRRVYRLIGKVGTPSISEGEGAYSALTGSGT